MPTLRAIPSPASPLSRLLRTSLALPCPPPPSFVSYLGPFNKEFRELLLTRDFYATCVRLGIPCTKDLEVGLGCGRGPWNAEPQLAGSGRAPWKAWPAPRTHTLRRTSLRRCAPRSSALIPLADSRLCPAGRRLPG